MASERRILKSVINISKRKHVALTAIMAVNQRKLAADGAGGGINVSRHGVAAQAQW